MIAQHSATSLKREGFGVGMIFVTKLFPSQAPRQLSKGRKKSRIDTKQVKVWWSGRDSLVWMPAVSRRRTLLHVSRNA